VLASLVLLPMAVPAAADLAEIEKRGSLRVLVILDEETEFFSGRDGDNPGFDHEILEGFARLHRLKLELVPMPSWDSLIPALLQGGGDVIAGRFTITESRKNLIDFTFETFPTRNVVVTRRPHRTVNTLEELRQERISVTKGTSMAELLTKLGIPAAHLDFSIATGGKQSALRAGRISCTVHEVYTAMMSQRQDPDIQIGLFLGPPLSLGYGVRKGDPQLLKGLNDYLLNTRKSGTWSRLVVKYLGESAPAILSKSRAQ